MIETLLKDALYNTHIRSGASVDYGRGIVVGTVAALMATGHFPFMDALDIVSRNLPKDYRIECMPESWLDKS